MKKLGCLLLLVLLSSCKKEFSGKLVIDNEVSLHGVDLDGEQYTTTFTDGDLNLNIKIEDGILSLWVDLLGFQYDFKIPGNTKIPKEVGNFFIDGTKMNQDYHFYGRKTKEISYTEPQTITQDCYDHYNKRRGQKMVTFHYKVTDYFYMIDLFRPNLYTKHATLKMKEQKRRKIYLQRKRCQ